MPPALPVVMTDHRRRAGDEEQDHTNGQNNVFRDVDSKKNCFDRIIPALLV